MPSRRLALCLLAACLALPVPAGAATKLLRFPDLHGDFVVFTYAGDLWRASADGGVAERLTAHPGLELFAKVSPDGRWIAFTGQYDGDEQVYVVPIEGGEPRQLTFYPAPGPLPPRWGYDNQVHGWTPDGERVLFRSMRDGWDLSDTRLYTVDRDGGHPEALPMPVSGAGEISPDGGRVAYSPLARDFRHWKRYRGGWAQDLYLFDLATHDATRITDDPFTDRDPMWIGDLVVFASDRSGTLNLYAHDTARGTTEQLTRSTVWDVRWPSADPATRRVVYETDGELEIFDLATRATRRLAITVPADLVAARARRVPAADAVEGFAVAPGGKRAAFAARGDLFSVPAEHGRTRNLTATSGAHDRQPAWSPDGRWIAFVSDRDGEEEIWRVAQDGSAPPEQLTDGHTGSFFGPVWSPDSTRLAFQDQQARLYVLDVATRAVVEVADDATPFGLDYAWSPDSRWLAYTLADPNALRSIWIWSRDDGESRRVTGELWNEVSPAWSPDGKHLFYLSDRQFAPQIGSFEFNYVADRETYLYALALTADAPHPFPPRSDEVETDGDADDEETDGDADDDDEDGEDDGDEGDEEAGAPRRVAIDFAGLAERVTRVPVEAANYAAVWATPKHLLYVRTGPFYYGRDVGEPTELVLFDRETREESVLVSGVRGLSLTPDGGHVLVGKDGGYQVLEVAPGGGESAKTLSTAGLAVDLQPREEWAQIFDEVWRRFRDYFYVENLHGYDWEALGDRYRPLLAHVAHRSDLSYVLAEMIAELNVSHAYVAGGDFEVPPRPRAALLGARFELDEASGRYRVAEVFPGHNEEPKYRSPLREVGVDVGVGDYVLAINGRELTAEENPYRLLRHAGGAPVELRVAERPDGPARQVVVDPIGDEDPLLYLRWVEANRAYVDRESGGRLGYLHVPDMGGDGLAEFLKWFYGQIRKEGLVVDVRSNGGGNVSQMLIERLRRELLMLDFERNGELVSTYPSRVFTGHLVCLLDEDTASDGDQFAYVFRTAGLGPLVGKRSWGGVVGIYGRHSLIDGGSVSVPESGSVGPDGEWVIEGHGVDPDVVVENDPREVLAGRDQQLETAVRVLLEKLESDPRTLPGRPSAPVKTMPIEAPDVTPEAPAEAPADAPAGEG